MVLGVCWNGCSIGMLMIYWRGYVPGSYDYRVERVCVCIDACMDLYVLAGIAVSCMGA